MCNYCRSVHTRKTQQPTSHVCHWSVSGSGVDSARKWWWISHYWLCCDLWFYSCSQSSLFQRVYQRSSYRLHTDWQVVPRNNLSVCCCCQKQTWMWRVLRFLFEFYFSSRLGYHKHFSMHCLCVFSEMLHSNFCLFATHWFHSCKRLKQWCWNYYVEIIIYLRMICWAWSIYSIQHMQRPS